MRAHLDNELLRRVITDLAHNNDPLLAVGIGLLAGCLIALFVPIA